MNIPAPRQEPFTLDRLFSIWPQDNKLRGVVLFGSRARNEDLSENSDWDVGIIYEGPHFAIEEAPHCWDLFLWETAHWERGFVLQLELARDCRVLYDPENLIQERLAFLQEKILPHYVRYMRRI